MQTAMKQAIESALPLSTPNIIGANMPNTVPDSKPNTVSDSKPDTSSVVVNDYTKSANACALSIIKAAQTRLAAWAKYAECVPNFVNIKAAAQALESSLTAQGFARAQAEASEWKAFCLVYHADKDAALALIDSKRTVIKRDKSGNAVKDAGTGEVVRIRPTSEMIVDDLRSTRDRLAKEEKIPKEVYAPRAVKAKPAASEVPGEVKDEEFSAILSAVPRLNMLQFFALYGSMIQTATTKANPAETLSQMVKSIQSKRLEAGYITAEDALQEPHTALEWMA